MIASGIYEEIIMAGFGGQGVMLIGKLTATAAMKGGYRVTFMPSYGAEVRGGTANCMVVIADEPIASPVVTVPNALIAMNTASFDKFTPRLKTDGLLIANSCLIESDSRRTDIDILRVPADEIALELNSPKSANMVALGAYLHKRNLLDPADVAACLDEVLSQRHHKTIAVNTQAILRGAQFVKEDSA